MLSCAAVRLQHGGVSNGIVSILTSLVHLTIYLLLMMAALGPIDSFLADKHVPFCTKNKWLDQAILAVIEILADVIAAEVVARLIAYLRLELDGLWHDLHFADSLIFALSVFSRQASLMARLKGVGQFLQSLGL